jgi:alanine racemase
MAMSRTELNINPSLAGALLTINLDAVAQNWRALGARSHQADCAAVVKADGYGLGAAEVGARLYAEGCRIFFVAHPEEGIALRPHVGDAAIYILNGLMPGTEADYAAHRLAPVLNDPGQVAAWVAWCAAEGPHLAALHIDTGMTRLGLSLRDALELADDPRSLTTIGDVLVMSHLACADEPSHPLTAEQLDRFTGVAARFRQWPQSLANSSGIFLGEAYHFDLLRPGVALFGGNPVPGTTNPMKPVVTLSARILQLREIDSPLSVGYGATHRAAPPAKIATIAAGYADGILRALSNRGALRLAGHEVPLVGRVSMDLITVDVSSVPDTVLDAATHIAGTIGYEVLTSMGRRYHRDYVGLAS